MADPCTVVKLSVTNLDRAVKDPALAALLAEGWDVVASVVVAPVGAGEPLLHVVLRPPRPQVQGAPGGWAPAPTPMLLLLLLVGVNALGWLWVM